MNKIIVGIHSIQATIKNKINSIKEIYVCTNPWNLRTKKLVQFIHNQYNHIPIINTTKQFINKYTLNIPNQGIFAIINKFNQYNITYLKKKLNIDKKNKIILILENISDPHNLGACLRTAAACGVDFVIISKYNSAKLNNPIVSKTACGGQETLKIIIVTNIVRTLKLLQQFNIWILGTTTDKTAKILFQYNFKILNVSIALVMGSEQLGLTKLTKITCDELLHIPLKSNNSLNVSVATAVCLFEIIRQQNKVLI